MVAVTYLKQNAPDYSRERFVLYVDEVQMALTPL